MSFILVGGLTKHYGTTTALKGIDLEVQEGEWVCIMGPSGSGKSTLLNLIGGLDRATGGRVAIDGVEINALSEDSLSRFRREIMGFIFQQSHFIPYLSAAENVMLAQYFHSICDEEEAREVLTQLGLGDRLHHRPSQLSGGEQQRVCIARAIINNPKLLLADEPTGNLDRENTILTLETLKELHKAGQFTILLVTHDPFVAKWAQRVVTIEDGRIVRDELNT